jgi:hypothetical protein
MNRRHFIIGSAAAAAAVSLSSQVKGQAPMTIQEAINATPDGTTGAPNVIDLGGQVFNVEETTRITGRNWLTLRNFTLNADTDGVTATPWTVASWPRNRSHIRVDGGSMNITIENVTITGPHPYGGLSSAAYVAAFEAQHAFDIDGADTVTIRNCQAFDVYGDFTYIRASNVVVEDCTFARNGRQGIAVARGTNIRVSRCDISDIRRSVFDLEPNSPADMIDGVVVEDCSTGDARLVWFTAGGPGSNVRNVTIQRNTMRERTGTPCLSLIARTDAHRGPFTVVDNVLLPSGSPQPGVTIQNIDGLTFEGNTVSVNPDRKMTGVKVTGSTGLKFTRNTFVGSVVDIAVA